MPTSYILYRIIHSANSAEVLKHPNLKMCDKDETLPTLDETIIRFIFKWITKKFRLYELVIYFIETYILQT